MSEVDELLDNIEKKDDSDNSDNTKSTSDNTFSQLDVTRIKQINPYNLAVIDATGHIVKTIDNDDLKVKSAKLIDFMIKEVELNPKFYNAHNLLKDIVEVKKAFFPETSKTLTVDATNIFEEQLNQWKKARLQIKSVEEVEKEIKDVEVITA